MLGENDTSVTEKQDEKEPEDKDADEKPEESSDKNEAD